MPAKNFEKMLCTALKDNKGSAYATCLDVNELIQRQPDRYKKKCFAAFLMLSDRKLPNKYSGEDSNDFYMWYLDYTAISAIFTAVNPVLSDAAQNMIPQDELIDRLWAIYCNSDLLKDDRWKASFLQRIWMDEMFPYYQPPTQPEMEDDEFNKIALKIDHEISAGLSMFNAPLPQMTQITKNIMDIATSLETEEERIVFWSFMLSHPQVKRIVRMNYDGKTIVHDELPQLPDVIREKGKRHA